MRIFQKNDCLRPCRVSSGSVVNANAIKVSAINRAMKRIGGYLSRCLSLVSLTAIAPLALALPATANSVISQSAPNVSPLSDTSSLKKIDPYFNLNHVEGAGFTGFTGVDAFYPITQAAEHNIFFAVGRLNMNNTGNLGGGLQGGYRAALGDSAIWGLYGGVDVRSTTEDTFSQAGFGGELLGEKWDIHLNANVPLGDTTRSTSTGIAASTGNATTTPQFVGNQLLLSSGGGGSFVQRSTSALTTVSLDGGVQLLDLGEGSTLWGRGGVYYLGGAASSDTLGVRASLDHWAQNNIRVGLGVQHDSIFDTNVTLSANVLLGAPAHRPTKTEGNSRSRLWARAGEPIARTGTVLLEETISTSGSGNGGNNNVVAINPATGQAYVFRHVDPTAGAANGDSTAEMPLDTLANVVALTPANANNIIYVQPGNAGGAVTIPDGVQVLSVGPLQQLNTQLGTIALPGSGSGNLPTVNGTVTIGNDTLLSGLAISPTGATDNGILATGSGTAIEDNTITNAFRGIRLPDIDGDISIARNQILGLSNDGIFFEDIQSTDDTTISITENEISTTVGGRAIDFDSIEGVADVTIADNEISTVEREGIYFGPIRNAADVNIAITGNQLPSVGADGIFFRRILGTATAEILIDDNTITNAGANTAVNNAADLDGIDLNAIVGNTNVTATISNNTIANPSANGVRIAHLANGDMCLALDNNTVNTPGSNGYELVSTGNGRFQVLNRANVTTANIGNFNPADIATNAAFVNGTAAVAPCP